MSLWPAARALLFCAQPEAAHAAVLAGLRALPALLDPTDLGGQRTVMGLDFPNPVGLAAGFDKSGDAFLALAKLGFGFIEVGTITPQPQSGSPKPRLFRLPAQSALINRMGFNSRGADYAARQLARRGRYAGVLGINIGRNRGTPPAEASADYASCMEKLYGLGDYFAVNVSSPNTPGLRELQRPDLLAALLGELSEANERLGAQHSDRMRLAVKVAPDLPEQDIEAMAAVIARSGIDAVIAANTTTARPPEVMAADWGGQPGGLSGAPLEQAAAEAARLWRQALPASIALIGCGGICTAQAAAARRAAGADLIQLYSGLIFAGPRLVAEAAAALAG